MKIPCLCLCGFLVTGSTLTFAAAPLSGLIAYLPLDEGSGGTVREVVSGTNAIFQGSDQIDWNYLGGQPYFLDSQYQRFETVSHEVGNGITNAITLSAFIRPVRRNDVWLGIITKGTTQAPYSFTTWTGGALNFGANAYNPAGGSATQNWTSSITLDISVDLEPPRLYHVAVTYDGSKVRFYIDGVKDPVEQSASITFGTVDEPLVIGADLPGGSEFFLGGIDEVAIYNRALSDAEIASLAAGERPLPAKVDPSYAGLWIGDATLDEVREVRTGTWSATPAPYAERVIIHVSTSGQVRLLPTATIMQTTGASPEQVIVSDPALITNYDGITPRGDTRVGQRFSSATLPSRAITIPLAQDGEAFSATVDIPASDPLNPFRHKYHPDLGTGFALNRSLSFDLPAADSPTDNTITGAYRTLVSGLHQDDLEARGEVTFTRVSTSGRLNN